MCLLGGTSLPRRDPLNPTCPKDLNWSTYRQMRFTLDTSSGHRILERKGRSTRMSPARLQDALQANGQIDEIWLRSPGGVARAGNEAGKIIRKTGIPTRIPNGWACFSACNFMFMGGAIRYVDPGAFSRCTCSPTSATRTRSAPS